MSWCFSLFVVLILVEMLTCPVSGGFKWCVIVFRFEKHVVTESRRNCVCLGRAEKAWIYIFVLVSVLWSTVYLPVATQMKIRAPGCEDSASAGFEITAVRTVSSYTNLLLLIIIIFWCYLTPRWLSSVGRKRWATELPACYSPHVHLRCASCFEHGLIHSYRFTCQETAGARCTGTLNMLCGDCVGCLGTCRLPLFLWKVTRACFNYVMYIFMMSSGLICLLPGVRDFHLFASPCSLC